MKSVDDSLISPSKNLLFVDKVSMFVFASEEKCDNGCCLILIHEMNFFLEVCSERGYSCSSCDEDYFFPFHGISKCGFS